jgi:hypothetical protein
MVLSVGYAAKGPYLDLYQNPPLGAKEFCRVVRFRGQRRCTGEGQFKKKLTKGRLVMKRIWTRLLRDETPRTRRPARGRSLRIEQFEERRVMDAAFGSVNDFIQDTAATVHVNSSPVQLFDDGTLAIYGGESNDDARVTAGGNNIYVTLNGTTYSFDLKTSFTYDGPAAIGMLVGPPIFLELSNVTQIEFYGGNGHDRFQNDTNLPTYAQGGKGNDFLIGGSAADRLEGKDGDDALLGREGPDMLIGGAGVDRIQGNEGRDTLRGGDDNDKLFGGSEDDKLHGDIGNDVLYGQEGVDTLWGGYGHDDLYGGSGFDNLVGGAGVDWFEPGPDNVWIEDPETDYVPYDGSTQMVSLDDNKSLNNLVPHNEQMAGVTAFLDLNNQWSKNLEQTREKILERLSESRPGGESLYDVSLTLPSDGYQEIAQDEWGTHLRLTVRGAYLEATSTQPTLLGSWADPRFGVTFDITIDVHLAPTGGLRVTNTVATISNASIHAANVVSDVLGFFNSLADFYTGINFKVLTEQAINGTQFKNAIDTSMTSLVNVLAPDASVVYDVASGVVLLRTARHSAPIDINTFSWKPSEYVGNESLEAIHVTANNGTGAATTLDQANFELVHESPWTDVLLDDRFSESYTSPIPRGDFAMFGLGDVASEFDWTLLNPQPLPPKEFYFDSAALGSVFDWALLNPQPLPPKDGYYATLASELDWVALNPQPLPPKEFTFDSAALGADFDWALLNPQPLPPKDSYFATLASELDWVALNPQPLPPKESYFADAVFASQANAVALNPQPLPPNVMVGNVLYWL